MQSQNRLRLLIWIATLRFQPTRRPQLSSNKLKAKSMPKPTAASTTAQSTLSLPTTLAPAAVKPVVKSTLADWTTVGDDDDVNGFYGGEKRQRGGRKRRKKNREEHVVVQDWDDIYDPARPNNYEEYKNSDEKIREVREWKERLYAHRRARRSPSEKDSEDEESYRPRIGSMSCRLVLGRVTYTFQTNLHLRLNTHLPLLQWKYLQNHLMTMSTPISIAQLFRQQISRHLHHHPQICVHQRLLLNLYRLAPYQEHLSGTTYHLSQVTSQMMSRDQQ